SAEELPFDFLMNALRLVEGVPSAWYQQRTGQSLAAIAPLLDKAVQRGLLEPWQQQLRPTEQGRLFLNDLLEMSLKPAGRDGARPSRVLTAPEGTEPRGVVGQPVLAIPMGCRAPALRLILINVLHDLSGYPPRPSCLVNRITP